MCLKHKLVLLSGGGKDGALPENLEAFFRVLTEKATLDYDTTELENIRVEIWNALKLNKPKQEQVGVSFCSSNFHFGTKLCVYDVCAARLQLNGPS
jgi:hypothetical protein